MIDRITLALTVALAASSRSFSNAVAPQGGVSHPSSRTNPRSSATAKEEFAEAQRLLRQGLLESARSAVLRGLELQPKSVEGYNLLGIIYGEQKDYSHAVDAFQQALMIDPRSTVTHNNLGSCYVTQDLVALAEKEFRTTLRLDPRNRDANFNLGLVLMSRGRSDQAVVFFRSVRPPDQATLLNLARAYFRSGQLARGLELAKKLSEQAQEDVRLHFSLGLLLASEKQYESALRELERADALQPRNFEILHNLGQAYLSAGKNEKAAETLQRALAVKLNSVESMVLLGRAYTNQRRDLAALEVLTRAHKLAPQNTDAIFLMARLSMMQSFHEDAIALLEEGVKLAPRRPDLHAALGESYFTVGKVDKAILEFQTLIRLDPSASSYAFMGLCYRHLGRFEEAKKYFQEGLKSDPHHAACLYNLGYIANKQGNPAEAEKLLEKALRANPDYDDALYELARVKMAQKKFEQAVPLLRKCAKITSKPAEVYYKLATAERALRQMEAADRDIKIFQTLSKDPNSGPYPYQHFFEFLSKRTELPEQARTHTDLTELLQEVQRHPDQPRNLYLLAETYLKLGQVEEAKKAVARLDQISGEDARTALGVGVLLARYRLSPEAIQHFLSALAADPTSDDAKFDLAETYFRVRDYSRALEVLQQVSPQAQNDDTVLALLADVYAHQDRYFEAIKVYQGAIAKNPDNDQYYLSLALTQMRTGEAGAADYTLRRGLARTPNSGKLHWGMGVLSVLQGNNSKAEGYLKESVDLMPEWQSTLSALGLFYYQTGQTSKARETLERSLELNPHAPLNIQRIQAALAAAPAVDQGLTRVKDLPPPARQQFLQFALALLEQYP